ncbi:PepSY domain-containing protein [Nitrospirillum iridis]|uniref:PepSY domain-containing protein n=1 Tax=Nitrospirillum iridis TaxID=765888 RepID=A0A7X0AVV5_9PROT|nr:PepSY domain-containing protein [Nitrospirillum iridis]MBB6251092.1 hypothetical protein [Nitrospirillum iridis]
MIMIRVAVASVLLTLAAGTALASEEERKSCSIPPNAAKVAPLSKDEIRAKLANEGLTDIRSLKEENGCLEAKGIDKSGKRFEVYVDPVTGAIVGRE